MSDRAAFFYGTLMFPGILHRVIYGSRNPEPWQQALTKIRPALLEGYQRHRVKDVQYPAIIPCKGGTVRGSVCTGLTDGDMWRLDIFEGDDYYKAKVKVKVLKDEVDIDDTIPDDKIDDFVVGEVEVEVYVWQDEQRDMLVEEEWDFEEFKRNKMKKWTGEDGGEDVDQGFRDIEDAMADVDEAAGLGGSKSSNGVSTPIRANDIDGGR